MVEKEEAPAAARLQKEHLARATAHLVQLLPPDQREARLDSLRTAWGAGSFELSESVEALAWLQDGPLSQEAAAALITAQLLMLPRAGAVPKSAWDYIDQCAAKLAFDNDEVHRLWGWLRGSADGDVVQQIEARLEAVEKVGGLEAEVVAAAKEEHSARAALSEAGVEPSQAYMERRAKIKSQVQALGPLLEALSVDGSQRKTLLRYLEGDLFRLAVLGEFKRGKSTLINALVGTPDLMPTDLLPCTSALTELRYGENLGYEVNEQGLFGQFKASDERTFQQTAANASSERTEKDSAEAAAESVPYWRVRVPSRFLEASRIALIDTPGLGEDHARDFIARAEAERADAAILVFDIEQTASLEELDLIERMKSKASDLLVVINKADRGDDEERERSLEHAFERIGDRTDAIPKTRIVPLSAFEAEEDLRHDRTGPWLTKLEDFRSHLLRHLVERSGPAREEALLARTRSFIADSRKTIDHELTKREKLLSDLEALQRNCDRTAKAFKLAELSVKTGTQILQNTDGTEDRLIKGFMDTLPKVLDTANQHEDSWTSKYSVITSPSKHAKEVAAKAQRSVLFAVEDWMRTEGAKIVTEGLDKQYQDARSKLDAYSAYLEDATGRDAQSHLDEVQKEALIAAFPGRFGVVETGQVVQSTVVGGALAAIVGYIIADIILFYLLKVIVGFLNPLLLASAALVGVAAYVVKGDEWVRAWIRKKIFDKISVELSTDAARDQMKQAFTRAVRELFTRVAHSFKASASEVLAQVRHAQITAEETLKTKQAQLGTPEAIKAELDRLTDHADRAKGALDTLKRTVESSAG